jgi:hypothetical protein
MNEVMLSNAKKLRDCRRGCASTTTERQYIEAERSTVNCALAEVREARNVWKSVRSHIWTIPQMSGRPVVGK